MREVQVDTMSMDFAAFLQQAVDVRHHGRQLPGKMRHSGIISRESPASGPLPEGSAGQKPRAKLGLHDSLVCLQNFLFKKSDLLRDCR